MVASGKLLLCLFLILHVDKKFYFCARLLSLLMLVSMYYSIWSTDGTDTSVLCILNSICLSLALYKSHSCSVSLALFFSLSCYLCCWTPSHTSHKLTFCSAPQSHNYGANFGRAVHGPSSRVSFPQPLPVLVASSMHIVFSMFHYLVIYNIGVVNEYSQSYRIEFYQENLQI